MEKLKIKSNTSDSDTSQSESSFETKNIKSQKNRRKRFYSWCIPRKTKAVNSSGEIIIDLSSNPIMKTRKSKKRAKAEKLRSKVFRSQKRINELARPRQMVFKTSQNSQQTLTVLRSQKRINDLLRPKKVTFEPLQHSSQSIKDSELLSNSKLSLTNFGINEKTTNLRTILRQEWTERINRLAEPKVREPTPTNIIGKVAEKALRATASKRIKELAEKKPLTLVTSQRKEGDPYKVSPQALKAVCSLRTKSLAVPKIFNIHSHYCNTEKVVH